MSHRNARQATLCGWGFISPWLLGFFSLTLFPFVASLYYSFCRYDLLSPPRWVGGENYRQLADELVSGGPLAHALWNTGYFALVSVPLSIALGIGLAVMLSWPVRGQPLFRTLLYLPSVLPILATAILWQWLFDPRQGFVNHTLGLLGLGQPGWFTSVEELLVGGTPGSKDALILMALWSTGNFMVIYLAALGDIPRSLYEAAQLDGASRWRQFWHITLPLLSPVIFFNLVMGTIQAIQTFTQIYVLSAGQGDPDRSLLVVSLHLFLTAFQDLRMGYASAMAWLLFVLVMGITWLLFRTARRWVFYQGAVR